MVPLTPLPEKFINLILAYTGIFNSFSDIKQHIEVDMFPNGDGKFFTGTEIYLCSHPILARRDHPAISWRLLAKSQWLYAFPMVERAL